MATESKKKSITKLQSKLNNPISEPMKKFKEENFRMETLIGHAFDNHKLATSFATMVSDSIENKNNISIENTPKLNREEEEYKVNDIRLHKKELKELKDVDSSVQTLILDNKETPEELTSKLDETKRSKESVEYLEEISKDIKQLKSSGGGGGGGTSAEEKKGGGKGLLAAAAAAYGLYELGGAALKIFKLPGKLMGASKAARAGQPRTAGFFGGGGGGRAAAVGAAGVLGVSGAAAGDEDESGQRVVPIRPRYAGVDPGIAGEDPQQQAAGTGRIKKTGPPQTREHWLPTGESDPNDMFGVNSPKRSIRSKARRREGLREKAKQLPKGQGEGTFLARVRAGQFGGYGGDFVSPSGNKYLDDEDYQHAIDMGREPDPFDEPFDDSAAITKVPKEKKDTKQEKIEKEIPYYLEQPEIGPVVSPEEDAKMMKAIQEMKERDDKKDKDQAKAMLRKLPIKEIQKAGARLAGGVAKSAAKKVPGIGLLAGGAFALDKLLGGHPVEAGMELASGAASTFFPGPGTAASIGIDAAITTMEADRGMYGTEEGSVSSFLSSFLGSADTAAKGGGRGKITGTAPAPVAKTSKVAKKEDSFERKNMNLMQMLGLEQEKQRYSMAGDGYSISADEFDERAAEMIKSDPNRYYMRTNEMSGRKALLDVEEWGEDSQGERFPTSYGYAGQVSGTTTISSRNKIAKESAIEGEDWRGKSRSGGSIEQQERGRAGLETAFLATEFDKESGMGMGEQSQYSKVHMQTGEKEGFIPWLLGEESKLGGRISSDNVSSYFKEGATLGTEADVNTVMDEMKARGMDDQETLDQIRDELMSQLPWTSIFASMGDKIKSAVGMDVEKPELFDTILAEDRRGEGKENMLASLGMMYEEPKKAEVTVATNSSDNSTVINKSTSSVMMPSGTNTNNDRLLGINTSGYA